MLLLPLLLAGCAHSSAPDARTATAPVATIPAASSCASLTAVDLTDIGGPGSRVTSATQSTSNGIVSCTVEATLAPSIGLRVQLPLATWTGRYLQVGCGGLCGRIPMEAGAADGCVPLAAGGFVIAGTDMGHQGNSGEFGRDPQKRTDFAHRAVHLTALASKKLIKIFYGRAERYAYFTGCSDGGREALVEAQRYPDDFDGIIAGAAAMNFQVQNGLYHAWQAVSNTGPDGKAILLAGRLQVLHAAVLKQCDALDGQVDGLLGDPRQCRVDVAKLVCPSGAQGADCLSKAEAEAARRLYEGPRDRASGRRLTVGGPLPGSELGWAGVFVPKSATEPIFSGRIALDALRNLSFENNPSPGFSLADVRFDADFFERLRPLHALYGATNPDLSRFAASGGKLILWHGWSDPHISPLNTIAYHEAVLQTMAEQQAADFERLYLLPGVYHCSGGEGPAAIDLLTPLMDWVENGVAPQAVVTHTSQRSSNFGQPGGAPAGQRPPGGPDELSPTAVPRSRPVFPYPQVATYDGKGDPNAAESYRAGPALFTGKTPDWLGADFYRPYQAKER